FGLLEETTINYAERQKETEEKLKAIISYKEQQLQESEKQRDILQQLESSAKGRVEEVLLSARREAAEKDATAAAALRQEVIG
ncbi:hypothetical protein EMWEY_00046350, partial [Eimeria maxima]